MNDLSVYSEELQEVLQNLDLDNIERVIKILKKARVDGRMVFIIGNGGSASTASHFVCDLTKNTRRDGMPLVRAVCLGDNIASMTAYGNDEGYDRIFAGQLENMVSSEDVLIAISTSGNSRNVLRAVEVAKKHHALTIGFTGADGGELARLVDLALRVPSNRIEYVEDVHLILEHMITARLRESIDDESLVVSGFEKNLAPSDLQSSAELGSPSGANLDTVMQQLPASLYLMDEDSYDITDLARRMLSLSVASVQAVSGSIVLLDENGAPQFGVMAHREDIWESENNEVHEMFEKGLAGWVVQNKQPVLVNNTLEDDRWFKREWETQASRSVICAPIMGADEVNGIITLVYPRREFFSEQDVVWVMVLATALNVLASQKTHQESVSLRAS